MSGVALCRANRGVCAVHATNLDAARLGIVPGAAITETANRDPVRPPAGRELQAVHNTDPGSHVDLGSPTRAITASRDYAERIQRHALCVGHR